ncbi:MAG: carboxymethylenebutenolidase [Holophagae bacterium]|nr:MAG: carboxymethylenebutenolidase [Holophagae bacterium]
MARQSLTTLLAVAAAVFAAGCGTAPDEQREYAERMAKEHAHDAPVANPASQTAPGAEVEASDVQYATIDGRPVTGYLARPTAAEGPLPGLIVIHEWWGLNDNIRAMARRLAGEGYAALAVDLYGGEVASDPDAALELMTAANEHPAAAEDNLRQAYAYLADQLGAPAVGSIGWCFGGGWSLGTALLLPDRLDAAVIYYGHLVTDPQRLATLEMPILGLFGEQDQGIPLASVRAFEAALRGLGKEAKIVVYPGADHAFANPSGRNYQPEAAEQAWLETVAFLERALKHGT